MNKLVLSKAEIISYYKSGLSCQKIVDLYNPGLSRCSISSLLRKWKVPIKDKHNRCRKYFVDNNYFNKIDTEEKAYWLGFLYADGCVFKSKTGEKKLQLKSIDKEVVDNFTKLLNSTYPIKISFNIRNGIKYYYYFVYITSHSLVDSLIKLGCGYKKTFKLKFPRSNVLPVALRSHFMRGYFDGDGCVTTFYRKGTNKVQLSSNICGTQRFCKQFQSHLPFIQLGKVHFVRNISKLNWYKTDSMKFYTFLYTGATIFLTRKRKKFEDFIKEEDSTTIISYPK